MSLAYGYGYADLPSETPSADGVEATTAAWDEWASSRGLYLWSSSEFAPIFMDIWIARVPSLGPPSGALHAVVMTRDRLLVDPNEEFEGGEGKPWQEVRREDVSGAYVLIGRDQKITAPESEWWRINQPTKET